MSRKYKFKLDIKGLRKEVLQADYMKEFIESEAQKRTDSNSHVKSFVGYDRVKSIIYPNTKEHKG